MPDSQSTTMRRRRSRTSVALLMSLSIVLMSGVLTNGHDDHAVATGDAAVCAPRSTVDGPTDQLPGVWQSLARSPEQGRFAHSAVWTGSEVIFWGGGEAKPSDSADFVWPQVGLAYDPAADSWRRVSPAPIKGRQGHSAIWTGTEMVVWGGDRGGRSLKDGAAYDPATDQWRRIARPAGDVARRDHHAVWTGEEMIVWSGYPGSSSDERPSVEGLRYDPAMDAWQTMTASGFGPREEDRAVWAGDELVAVGYASESQAMAAAYDPVTDQWHELPPPGLSAVGWASSMWTGDEVLFLTTARPVQPTDDVPGMNAAYRPSEPCWWYAQDAPTNAVTYEGLWADKTALFPGVRGLAYDPSSGAWLSLPPSEAMARSEAAVVWAGDRLVVWGGRRGESLRPLRGGVQFMPGARSGGAVAAS